MSQSKEDVLAAKNPKSSIPAKKLIPSLVRPQEMVTVNVKSKNKKETMKYVVHKDFACYHSQMLEKAFNGPFVEGQTQSIMFEFDYPETFGIVQNWMYIQKLEDGNGKALLGNELYKVWILAEYLLMPKLQNYATAQLLSRQSGFIPTTISNWIYKNTGPESKLRHLFVNTLAWDMPLDYVITMRDKGEMSEELLFDVVKVYKSALLDCHQCRRGLDCGVKSCSFRSAQAKVNNKLDRENYMVEENNS